MTPADATGARQAQPREEPRCPDCGSLDPCEHDEAFDGVAALIITLACVGLLAIVVAIVLTVIALVRWL